MPPNPIRGRFHGATSEGNTQIYCRTAQKCYQGKSKTVATATTLAASRRVRQDASGASRKPYYNKLVPNLTLHSSTRKGCRQRTSCLARKTRGTLERNACPQATGLLLPEQKLAGDDTSQSPESSTCSRERLHFVLQKPLRNAFLPAPKDSQHVDGT